ncbi:hypothetical protein DFJ74DRAFT_665413 [Hyaloraphidium curvatum]|nr:hypothetical protein DFJ74DRAFT_665413 [Hyaloraphidium curvatum]
MTKDEHQARPRFGDRVSGTLQRWASRAVGTCLPHLHAEMPSADITLHSTCPFQHRRIPGSPGAAASRRPLTLPLQMPGTQLGHELKSSGAIKSGAYGSGPTREARANLRALEGEPRGEATSGTPAAKPGEARAEERARSPEATRGYGALGTGAEDGGPPSQVENHSDEGGGEEGARVPGAWESEEHVFARESGEEVVGAAGPVPRGQEEDGDRLPGSWRFAHEEREEAGDLGAPTREGGANEAQEREHGVRGGRACACAHSTSYHSVQASEPTKASIPAALPAPADTAPIPPAVTEHGSTLPLPSVGESATGLAAPITTGGSVIEGGSGVGQPGQGALADMSGSSTSAVGQVIGDSGPADGAGLGRVSEIAPSAPPLTPFGLHEAEAEKQNAQAASRIPSDDTSTLTSPTWITLGQGSTAAPAPEPSPAPLPDPTATSTASRSAAPAAPFTTTPLPTSPSSTAPNPSYANLKPGGAGPVDVSSFTAVDAPPVEFPVMYAASGDEDGHAGRR